MAGIGLNSKPSELIELKFHWFNKWASNPEVISSNPPSIIISITLTRYNKNGLATYNHGKICGNAAFSRYTESVKFRSQSREAASKRT